MLYEATKITVTYPWQMTRRDFLSRAETLPRSRYEPEVPQDYSEAELHRVSLVNRQRETQPPLVPDYPIGSWLLNDDDSLEQLRLIPIHLPPMREAPNRYTVEKYIDWYASGSPFPPIRLVESWGYRLFVIDGHHRIKAAESLGLTHLPAWVSLSWYKHDGASLRSDSAYLPLVNAKAFTFGWCDACTLRDTFDRFRDVMRRLLEAPIPFNWYGHGTDTNLLKTLLTYNFVYREYGKHMAQSMTLTAQGRQIAMVLS